MAMSINKKCTCGFEIQELPENARVESDYDPTQTGIWCDCPKCGSSFCLKIKPLRRTSKSSQNLNDQMEHLILVANRLGYYDASDEILEWLKKKVAA